MTKLLNLNISKPLTKADKRYKIVKHVVKDHLGSFGDLRNQTFSPVSTIGLYFSMLDLQNCNCKKEKKALSVFYFNTTCTKIFNLQILNLQGKLFVCFQNVNAVLRQHYSNMSQPNFIGMQ